jgi:hypothetical protein
MPVDWQSLLNLWEKSYNESMKKKKPELIEYNQKVLLPFLEEHFVTKKEFQEFKNQVFINFDAIQKKLDVLLTEKTIREYRERKEKKLWQIIIKALKEHRILSQKELEEIAKLEIF